MKVALEDVGETIMGLTIRKASLNFKPSSQR